jgi:hypothetical protein
MTCLDPFPNRTFERMFSHPRSKLDLFAEMNAGKVILINTAKDLLKEQGTEIFGRFFIALIAQAAQERATVPSGKRLPTFVYVDEAADYFDRNIGLILSQARKFNVGMVLAHQHLGQLDPKLQEAFAANTSIKFAGGVSARDARTLAPMLYCDPRSSKRSQKAALPPIFAALRSPPCLCAFPSAEWKPWNGCRVRTRRSCVRRCAADMRFITRTLTRRWFRRLKRMARRLGPRTVIQLSAMETPMRQVTGPSGQQIRCLP